MDVSMHRYIGSIGFILNTIIPIRNNSEVHDLKKINKDNQNIKKSFLIKIFNIVFTRNFHWKSKKSPLFTFMHTVQVAVLSMYVSKS